MAHLGEVAANLEQFKAAGTNVLAIGQARPALLALHLRRLPYPFPVVSDPDRNAYRAFGLERTSFLGFLRPSVLWGYMRLILRGVVPRMPYAEEDVYQLGGDFLLDREGQIVFAHRSRTATDRPSIATLLAAIRDATAKHR